MPSKIVPGILAVLATLAAAAGPAAAGTVSTEVPEPTSLALLSAGIAGAALVRFRRRK